jgi:hypothetical protein
MQRQYKKQKEMRFFLLPHNNEQIDNYVNQSQPQNSSLILAIHHSSAVTQIIFIVTVKLSTKLKDNKTGP